MHCKGFGADNQAELRYRTLKWLESLGDVSFAAKGGVVD